jgi:hypothetical protein
MLLVSPVTWDAALPILLAPFALLTRTILATRSRWLMATLGLILAINSMPQQLLTKLALAGRSMSDYSWAFMLGFPSLKFYTLLGTFVLVLIAFVLESNNPHLQRTGEDIVT